jgi:hypothetical protein
MRLFFNADGHRVTTQIRSVATASSGDSGTVEVRVALPAGRETRTGVTGEASVALRQSNVWGSLWWGIRRRIRSDILL